VKLVMTLLVHNEIDVLETSLEYHRAQGVDFFVATDRKSDDGSREVLERWQEQGRLRLIREDVDHFAQGPWVTRMARLAHADHGADWVINNDVDEFWWPREGTLATALADVPAQVGVVTVGRTNFAARPDGDGPFYERLLVREVQSTNPAGRPLPPKVIHRGDPAVEVHWGNHGVVGDAAETLASDAIEIFHYPMRSYPQFERKIVSGARALERNREVAWEVGHTWRRLYALFERGELPAYYQSRLLTDAEVERGVAAGTHVVDRRLADFLAARADQVILVDESDREIGHADKLDAHRDGGRLHRAFSVFIFDGAGRMLLQRRAAAKYHFGGLWTNACCSHPRRGEETGAAAHRRLREELGFDTELRELFSFVYTASDARSGLSEREFDHVFAGRFDGEPRPAPDEVEAVRWVDPDELARDLALHPERYTPWFAEAAPRVAAWMREA